MALGLLSIIIISFVILLISGGAIAYALYINSTRDEEDELGNNIGLFIGCGIIALVLLLLIGFVAFFFFGFVPVGP